MELRLERLQYRSGCTIGRMYVDGRFECYTLEDGIRTNKVYGETAIPAGEYRIDITYSPRFKRNLPLLCDVPNFEGVRIHPGNAPANTLGCILVGQQWSDGDEVIGASRAAFNALFQKINDAAARAEPVMLRVIQENAPPALAARAIRRLRAVAKPQLKKTVLRESVPKRKKSAARRAGTKRTAARKTAAGKTATRKTAPTARRKAAAKHPGKRTASTSRPR
ncbi:MAG TPA: DUF5675 family protein [Steroidobacteraceae bacterium]|nr:DUF5675 family protein [Steroidobacteraceae bacterium]